MARCFSIALVIEQLHLRSTNLHLARRDTSCKPIFHSKMFPYCELSSNPLIYCTSDSRLTSSRGASIGGSFCHEYYAQSVLASTTQSVESRRWPTCSPWSLRLHITAQSVSVGRASSHLRMVPHFHVLPP